MTTGYKIMTMTSLAFSAAFLTAVATMPAARAQMGTSGTVVVTNGPQTNPGDRSNDWSARPCCMDQPVDAVIPGPRGLIRCGRSSGVPAPACG